MASFPAGGCDFLGRVSFPTTSLSTPDELLAEFRETGSEQAFEEIVRRYAGMVFSVCLRACRNPHDAEDATQAVFLKLAAQCKTDRSVRKVGPWLQQVAKRTALDVRRSRRRREAREQRHGQMNGNGNGHGNGNGNGDTLHPYANGRSGEIDLESLNSALVEELGKLPGKYRMPLVSLYFGGISRDEIAKELGLKPSALGVRIHRARQMLAKRLVDRGAAPPGLVLSSVIGPAAAAWFGRTMMTRTAEAAARISLGKDLAGTVSAHVLTIIKEAAAAAAMGKLKIAVSILLLMAMAVTGASAAERYLPGDLPVLREIKQALAPFRWPMMRLPSLPSLPSLPTTHTPSVPQLFSQADNAKPSDTAAPRTPVVAVANTPAAPIAAPTQSAASPTVRSTPAPAPDSAPVVVATLTSTAPRTAAVSAGPAAMAIPFATSNTPAADQRTAAAAGPRLAAVSGDNGSGGKSGDAFRSSPFQSGSGDVAFARKTVLESLWTVPGASRTAAVQADGSGPATGPRVKLNEPTLTVASAAGSRGLVEMNGGEMRTGAQDVGRAGFGQVSQTGGLNRTTQVRVGADVGGVGTYAVNNNAALQIEPVADRGGRIYGGLEVGGAGSGTLAVGDAATPGTIRTTRTSDSFDATPLALAFQNAAASADSALVVRSKPEGTGTFRGWGSIVGANSAFVQNGQTIADGYGTDRSLIFVGYPAVTSTIENPTIGGTNGWFATERGRLVLPAIPTQAGTHTYTWGEDPNDPTIDLVNSVRITLYDAKSDDRMSINLLAKDRSDVPTLPKGHTFIGVWSLDTNLARPSAVDLLVRYDDGLAADLGLNENVLKLWYYDSSGWHLLLNDPSFSRDVAQNLLFAHAPGSPSFFAVSAPEPTGIALLALGAAATFMRRRRRSL